MEAIENRVDFPVCPDRSESDALKGVFILLVVFAHNALLVDTSSPFQHYFYQFHYFTFFILPFLYPAKKLSGGRLADHFVKFYVPYFWFFIFSYLLYNLALTHNGFHFKQFFSSFWSGEISQLKDATGFRFLWFLPTFFMFTLLRETYSRSILAVQILLVLIGLFFHFSTYLGLPSYYDFRVHIPLAIVQAFYFFPIGAITLLLLKYVPRFRIVGVFDPVYKIYGFLLSALIFIWLSVDFFYDGQLAASTVAGEIRNLFLPAFFFIALYCLRSNLAGISWLKVFGHYSLEIYLIHIFVYNILFRSLLFISPDLHLWMGVVLFVATLLVTLLIVKILEKWELTRKILFPKELKSLTNVLK